MNQPKRKGPKFRKDETVNLPVTVLKVDRRFKPHYYFVQMPLSAGRAWVLESYLRPLNAKEVGPGWRKNS